MPRSYEVIGNDLPLTPFDLSHNHFLTMNLGYVYPVMWTECVPGDVFQLDFQSLFRCLPLVAPILNNLTVTLDVYFVPTRLLWPDWEKFITTVDDTVIPTKSFEGLQPTWMQGNSGKFKSGLKLDYSNGSLWRCFGLNSLFGSAGRYTESEKGSSLMPVVSGAHFMRSNHLASFISRATKDIPLTVDNSKYFPIDFLRRGYWFIYNEWYRDQNLEPPVDFMNPDTDVSGVDQQRLFKRAWDKDYFTAGFTNRQKGIAPSIPVSGTANAVFTFPSPSSKPLGVEFSGGKVGTGLPVVFTSEGSGKYNGLSYTFDSQRYPLSGDIIQNLTDNPYNMFMSGSLETGLIFVGDANAYNASFQKWLTDNNKIDLSNLGTFDVNDMRDLFAIQKFFEALMRGGSRYIEMLQSIYGVSPSDARLSLPERLGGVTFNVNISEVLQTSASNEISAQGNQTGHGLSVSEGHLASYKCEEFGFIYVLADVRPPAVYKQRMPRELMRKSLLEQFNPYFINLGYQAITKGELYFQGTADDEEIFNYGGRYDEMREKLSYVSGNLLDVQGYYLNSREFSSSPSFNSDFIRCNPNTDIFAVTDEDQFVVNFYWILKALRPLPLISDPGLIDHVYGGLAA